MRKKIVAGRVSLLLTFSLSCLFTTASAQQSKEEFKVVNRKISVDNLSGAVHLNEVDSIGIAWITGRSFRNGTIEFDLMGKNEFQGSFLGMAFHGSDDKTYECIYFRPFNFRTSDPVRKLHAVQYMSVPQHDWLKLRTEFPNQYEQPVSESVDPSQWFHVKIEVTADHISVYINGNDMPVLNVRSLALIQGDRIGYWVGNGSGGNWKNLKITADQ